MGFLRTDYSNTGDFSALPIGEYEVFISKVTIKETSTKKPMLNVEMTIRDDVEQEGRKRKLFDNLVVQDNMMWKFNQVAKAAQLPEGQEIATHEDFAAAIQFKAVRVKNKHEEYNGEKQDRIAFYKVSSVGGDFGNGEGDTGGTGETLDISDDDLPF